MTFCNFHTTTYGKWILVGEHAVLRGYGALVFPMKEKKLNLSYFNDTTTLALQCEGRDQEIMPLLFMKIMEHGYQLIDKPFKQLRGRFHLTSNLPIGCGMGASAAFCVAVSRWFSAQGLLINSRIFDFAKQLEHLFHSKSSGLDIAGVAAERGIYFCQGEITSLAPTWQPHWFLSFCGETGLTAECVTKVNHLATTHPSQAKELDEAMAQAVKDARAALEKEYTLASLLKLKEAINKGAACFRAWGLITDSLEKHMAFLLNAGALAVKPTGSGSGGYVLSLWEKQPSPMVDKAFIIL